MENSSKSFRCGIADLRRVNKVVYQYSGACPATCHVRLLDMYIDKLPAEAKSKDCFYFTPLQKLPGDPTKPWFSAIPVGWNELDRMVKEMLEEVNIAGKSNHSLRVTGATRMYKHGIKEKTIQSRTGHKVLKLSGSMRGLVLSNIEGHVKPWRTSLILQKSNWFSYQDLKYLVFCLQFIPVLCQFLECVLRLLLLILMVVLLKFLLDLLSFDLWSLCIICCFLEFHFSV